jgi:hypothetical protein
LNAKPKAPDAFVTKTVTRHGGHMLDNDERMDDGFDSESAEPKSDEKKNVIVEPLSDDDLTAGKMAKKVCWIRIAESAEARRQRRQRKKRARNRERAISVKAADNEPAREFIRKMAAITIQDAAAKSGDARSQPVFEAVLSNLEYFGLITDVSSNPEIWEAVRTAWQSPGRVKRRHWFGIKRFLEMTMQVLVWLLTVLRIRKANF